MSSNLICKILNKDSIHYNQAVLLAKEVLQKPLGLKFSEKEIEQEEQNILVAGFLEDALCATATMTREDDKIFLQHLAVKQDLQNKGIGSQLLQFCEEFAIQNQSRVIYANARDGAGKTPVNFFIKNEYFCGEEEFFVDNLPHKIVWKILT
ncbi:MAG: N-acetyltransferase [Proteobacteria bacterium]|nr:N-acetyltransferase [Pseudomonadota bacterium]